MKKILILLLTAGVFSLANAQSTDLPKDGVILKVENTKVIIQKGIDYEFDILMVRSKRARKAKFETPRIFGNKGISFDIKKSEENVDIYKVVANTENIEPGKYFYTITCKSKGMQKAKGVSMSFEVNDGPAVASN